MSESTYHMIQLPLRQRKLMRLLRDQGLPLDRIDQGYMAHAGLSALFGDQAPQPYHIDGASGKGRDLRLLGYADDPVDHLENVARLHASPKAYEVPKWDEAASKPMPTSLPEGMRLKFHVRSVPIRRVDTSGSGTWRGEKISWEPRTEHDPFIIRQSQTDDDLSRRAVYADWFTERVDGARVESFSLDRFSVEKLSRRNGDQSFTLIDRLDATLTGTLVVEDPVSFADVLRRGIGRHKTFGYGMLRVAPA